MRAQNRWCWLKMTCTASMLVDKGAAAAPEAPNEAVVVCREALRLVWLACGLDRSCWAPSHVWKNLEQNLELVLYLSQPSRWPKTCPSSQSNRSWVLSCQNWLESWRRQAGLLSRVKDPSLQWEILSHVPHAWVLCLVWCTCPDSSSELISPPSVNMLLFLLKPSLGGEWGADLSNLMY